MKLVFWRTKIFFRKLGYPFLVQSTKIESAIFLHKTAMSEANSKTYRMGNTKSTSHKGRSLTSNYIIFLKILFQNQSTNLFKELIRYTNYPDVHIHTLCRHWSFIFILWVSLTDQMSFFDCLYFLRYWTICVLQLFISQVVTS